MWAHHRTQRTQHPAQQLELNAGPTGSSHARPPNRPPRTGQAAPGRPGSGGAGRGWEWRRPQPAAEPGPGGGGRWSSPEVGVPRAAVDGGRGHTRTRAGRGCAHVTAPQPLAAPFPDLSLYLISSIVVAFTRNPGESRARGLAPPSAPAPPGAPA